MSKFIKYCAVTLAVITVAGFCRAGAANESFASEADPDRQAVICVLSWYSPLGSLNGVRHWRNEGYRYAGDKKRNPSVNYPILTDVSWPTQSPAIGSEAFYGLLREGAEISQRQMLQAGFDVMAFDMLPMPDYDPSKPLDEVNSPLAHFKSFLVWLKVAEKTGLKVGLMPDVANQSADYPQRRHLTADEWVRVLSGALDNTPDSSALWKIDGRPVVIHFGTDVTHKSSSSPIADAPKPDGGWRDVIQRLRDSDKELFFIADIRPSPLVSEWDQIADGAYIFAPAAPDDFLTEYQTILSGKLKIPYLWTVSPGYYRAKMAYTQPDFQRIHNTYMGAIKSDARWIYVMTWNDFAERTDIMPSVDKGDCFLNLFSFYNQWFKTGEQPKPEANRVILSYPVRVPDHVSTPSPVYTRLAPGGGNWTAAPYQPKVFYWAYIHSPTTLSVPGVGQVDLSKPGVIFGELGCIAPGPVQAALGGAIVTLPPVEHIVQEPSDGGLEYRYVDITDMLR